MVCLNTGPSGSVLDWLVLVEEIWWRRLPSRWKKLSSTYTMERPCINILVSSLLDDFCTITIFVLKYYDAAWDFSRYTFDQGCLIACVQGEVP